MGTLPLSISSITTSGDFAETNGCGTAVPPAGNCTFSIVFTPTTAGLRSGSVLIQDDAAGSPHLINLSGDGAGPLASVTPVILTFPSQQVGTSSAAQTATLTNGGDVALSFSSIQVTGDYQQTNNCPAQLPADSSCAINVTFSPTVTGTRNGTLTASDNAGGSPQTESLTGVGSDFGLTTSQGSETIKAGSTANYNLTVSPIGGSFAYAVKLSCSGLPALTSCSLTPSTVTPGTNSPVSLLSISTSASVAEVFPLRPLRGIPACAVWIQLQAIGLLGVMLVVPKGRTRKPRGLILMAVVTIALIFMTACAGGTGIAPIPQAETTPGTYSVSVTGTSGNLQHSLLVTLVVQ
jgi:hypothetical protein